MSRITKTVNRLFDLFLTERVRETGEKIIIYIAVGSFLIHLGLILLTDWGVIDLPDKFELLSNPIGALYTPFSFILVYEVYLLVYFLPRSITTYITKQYEIITLIIIRKIFKDLSSLELSGSWGSFWEKPEFIYDIGGSILLFVLLFLFELLRRQQNSFRQVQAQNSLNKEIKRFINLKKGMAIILVPLLVVLAFYSLEEYVYQNFFENNPDIQPVKDVNHIFYDEFFDVLIITEVLLLLFSFLHTNYFYKVIRNSGFIISTVLIKLSFGVDGAVNTVLIIFAVLFGVIIMTIHNQFEKLEMKSKNYQEEAMQEV